MKNTSLASLALAASLVVVGAVSSAAALAASTDSPDARFDVTVVEADWKAVVECANETNGARTAQVTVTRENAAAYGLVVTAESTPVPGGFSLRATVVNESSNWRVVKFFGPDFAVAGANPQTQALYVPQGLGCRVTPLAGTKAPLTPVAQFKPNGWQDSRWFATPDGGLFYGTGSYPAAMGLTMPFLVLGDETGGVYLGRHDPRGTFVRFELAQAKSGQALRARAVHRTPVPPKTRWTSPSTVCRSYAGDWRCATRLYRRWRDAHARRPIDPPDWLKDVTGWLLVIMRQQNEEIIWKYGDMDRLCDLADANGLDMIGLFGWTVGGHDHLYPDYVASDEMGGEDGLRQAIALAHRRGKRICIYANGQLQQVDGSDFWREKGRFIALEDRAGDRHLQFYPKYSNIPRLQFALGCYHATAWRERMTALAYQACGFGADGILYDQLGVMEPWLCYGAGHGHPVPENSHESDRADFLVGLFAELRDRAPGFVLMTEGMHDTIVDTIACFHGCETGCFQTRLSWAPDVTKGADAWTRKYVFDADGRFSADPGTNVPFPELYRYTFPEAMTTVRVPSPLMDRTMANWTLLFGLRTDIELRYAPDRAYAVDGKIPTRDDYRLVCSPPDIGRMRALDRAQAYAGLKAVNDFQRTHANLLLRGRFSDEDGIWVRTSGVVFAKRYDGLDGAAGVLVWNVGAAPADVAIQADGRHPTDAFEPGRGRVDVAEPLAPDTVRLLIFAKP